MADIVARDIFVRNVSTDGKSYVSSLRVWDVARFLKARNADCEQMNEKARTGNQSALVSIQTNYRSRIQNGAHKVKEKIVIKIGDAHFLDPSYQETANALHSLTHDATTAYGWQHVYNAQRCARLIAQNECRGMRVTVQRYIISESKTPQLLGDDNG